MRTRCPQCAHPVEVPDDHPLTDIVCPSCDGSFSLAGAEDRTAALDNGNRRIGRFEVLDCLGMGAYGTVWRARDPELDRLVAVTQEAD